MEQGQPLQLATPDLLHYTDVLDIGWGASLLQDSVSCFWDSQERFLHINVLELRGIGLGLHHFTEVERDSVVAVFSDNTTLLAYLSREGGTHSTLLNKKAHEILDWTEAHSVKILTSS